MSEETEQVTAQTEEVVGPSGIGGWLILPAIGLILSPFLTISTIATDIDYLDSYSRYAGLVTGELVILCVLLIFQIFVAVNFYRKKKSAPKLMIYLLGFNAGINVLLYLWVIVELGEATTEITTGLLRGIAVAAV